MPLGPGEHRLVVWAESDVSKGQSDALAVTCVGRKTVKPCLYVLAIGAASYPGRWKLHYADADAGQVASVFDRHSREIFEKVEIRSLLNGDVTKAKILEGLAWLKARLAAGRNPQDVGVIFYSGHGWADQSGEFFLLPVDAVTSSSQRTIETIQEVGIPATAIKKFCQEVLPCRLAIFLDACHSGAADVAGLARISAARDNLGRQLARSDCGVVLIASSKGSQNSPKTTRSRPAFLPRPWSTACGAKPVSSTRTWSSCRTFISTWPPLSAR